MRRRPEGRETTSTFRGLRSSRYLAANWGDPNDPPQTSANVHRLRFDKKRAALQKLKNERTPTTSAFFLRLPSELSTPPPGLMTYCRSGCSIHHGLSCA